MGKLLYVLGALVTCGIIAMLTPDNDLGFILCIVLGVINGIFWTWFSEHK